MREYIESLGYVPVTAVWETTLACNLTCLHCGSRAGRPRKAELDTNEALKLVRDLAKMGCKRVCMSGGEPLLRKDWPRIMEEISRQGMTASMITNGQAFTAGDAATARNAGMRTLGISIDGVESTHEAIRGAGTYAKTQKAMDLARSAGLHCAAITHVNTWNLDQLPRIHGMLKRHDIRVWQVQTGRPSGNMLDHRDLVIQPRDLLRLIPEIAGLIREGGVRVVASDSIGYFGPQEELLRRQGHLKLPFFAGCMAGCRVVGIESDGGIKGCLSLPSQRNGRDEFLEGNLRERSLSDIWHDPNAFAFNRQFTPAMLRGFCATCPYGRICRGGCRWTVTTAGGGVDNPYCHYRVLVEEQGRRRGLRRRHFKTAAAFLAAALAAAGCSTRYDQPGSGLGPYYDPFSDSGQGDAAAGANADADSDADGDVDADADADADADSGCPDCPDTPCCETDWCNPDYCVTEYCSASDYCPTDGSSGFYMN